MRTKILKFENEKEMENVILTFLKYDIRFTTIGRRELVYFIV